MKRPQPKKHFYTLVEIMTVIVIAALLFGIGIPAFTTMIQGRGAPSSKSLLCQFDFKESSFLPIILIR